MSNQIQVVICQARSFRIARLATFFQLGVSSFLLAGDWPQFRGPNTSPAISGRYIEAAPGCPRCSPRQGLGPTPLNKLVYSECHDEAGNDSGSLRTLPCAVNSAPIIGATRGYAEARARVAFSLSLFSAGTPMFFMGEEIGAQKIYVYNTFMANREDLFGERTGNGAHLFRFYQDAIRFSGRHSAISSRAIDIIHVNGDARVVAFTRHAGTDNLLLVASFNNQSFGSYSIQTDPSRLTDGSWLESFNSDATIYGGNNVGNAGGNLPAKNGQLQLCIPANGIVILAKV